MWPRAFLSFLACLVLLAAASPTKARDASTDFNWRMLLDRDTRLVVSAARAASLEPPDPDTLELVAEVLAARTRAHAGDRLDLDAVAYLVKTLGASGNGRYRSLVEQAVATYANPKLDAHAQAALANLPTGASDPYVPGTVSVADLRQQIDARFAALHGKGGQVAQLRTGLGVHAVFEAVGLPPNLFDAPAPSGSLPALAQWHAQTLRLLYPGQGQVELGNRGEGWVVFRVWPVAAHDAVAYTGQFPAEAELLLSSPPRPLKRLIERMRARGEREPALLDRLAERMRASMATREKYEVAGFEHGLLLLGESKDARYLAVLDEIAQGAVHPALRKRARQARELIQEAGTP